jgi:RNA polymerase-binding transcription factor DksA
MAAKKTASNTTAKKTAAKKPAPSKASVAAKAATKKAPAKKSAEPNAAAKKAPAKKAPAKKAQAARSAAVSESSKVDEARAIAAARLKDRQKLAAKSFSKPFVKKQEAELLREREKYTRSAVSYREEADSLVLDREPGDVQFDEESGEGDTLSVERERDLALSAQAQQAVEEIDAALQRLAHKVYGICVESGLPIPKERLEAIPWASQRVEYKVGGLGRR